MAGSKKISQLSELSLLADEDYIEIIDSSESSQDLKNKFTTLSTLRGFLNSTTQTSVVFEDWDSGTTYDPNDGDQYVFYNGIIYFFIKGSNSTNERPDLFPLVWDAKTATDFAHIQNTDQYLDFGGANQVAVADVFLKTGARAMTGDLNLGTNDITDVGSIEIENGGTIANEAGTVIFTPNADGSFSLTGESDGFIASTTRVDISAPAFQFDTDLGVLDESWITGGSTSLELGFGTSGKATFDSTGFSLLQGTDNEFSITSAGANVIHDTFIGLQIGSDYVFSSDGTDSFIASTGEIGVTGDEVNLTADASASISSPAINLTGVITFFDVTDDTKALTHDISGITTETTRTVTWPDKDITVAGLDDIATLNVSAYKFLANNTGSTADAAEHDYRAPGIQVFSETITFTASAEPSGATNHSYNWVRIGNLVHFVVILNFATPGTAVTNISFPLPSDMPDPNEPSGLTGASDNLYFVQMRSATGSTATPTVSNQAAIRRNAGDTGYEFSSPIASNNYTIFYIVGEYYTA